MATEAESSLNKDVCDVALDLYSASKQEITTRIRARDGLLATYSAAATAVIGAVASSNRLGDEFLYALPYLALVFTALVSYHHAAISTLGRHCALDLLPIVKRCGGVVGFELSETFWRYYGKSPTRRSAVHMLILLTPAAWALWRNHPNFAAPEVSSLTIWFSAVLINFVVCPVIVYSSNLPHFRGAPPSAQASSTPQA